MALVKRCPRCNISPQPKDLDYFWGNTAADRMQEQCLSCRTGSPLINPMPMIPLYKRKLTGRAMVVLVSKLYELPPRLISEYLLGSNLRDCLRLRGYNHPIYISDGERLWPHSEFPGNRANPIDWQVLVDEHGEEWDMYEPTGTGIRIMAEEEVTPDEAGNLSPLPNFAHIMM